MPSTVAESSGIALKSTCTFSYRKPEEGGSARYVKILKRFLILPFLNARGRENHSQEETKKTFKKIGVGSGRKAFF